MHCAVEDNKAEITNYEICSSHELPAPLSKNLREKIAPQYGYLKPVLSSYYIFS